MWIVYALLAALFSALTAILSKAGLSGINSTYATAIRTSVVLIMSWLMVGVMNIPKDQMQVNRYQLLFLVLSGIATGGAWLFYNRALQMGPATRVASVDKLSIVLIAILSAIIFKEEMTWKSIVSICMIAGGTVLLVFS